MDSARQRAASTVTSADLIGRRRHLHLDPGHKDGPHRDPGTDLITTDAPEAQRARCERIREVACDVEQSLLLLIMVTMLVRL